MKSVIGHFIVLSSRLQIGKRHFCKYFANIFLYVTDPEVTFWGRNEYWKQGIVAKNVLFRLLYHFMYRTRKFADPIAAI